jgi:hypothetical protein
MKRQSSIDVFLTNTTEKKKPTLHTVKVPLFLSAPLLSGRAAPSKKRKKERKKKKEKKKKKCEKACSVPLFCVTACDVFSCPCGSEFGVKRGQFFDPEKREKEKKALT